VTSPLAADGSGWFQFAHLSCAFSEHNGFPGSLIEHAIYQDIALPCLDESLGGWARQGAERQNSPRFRIEPRGWNAGKIAA